MQEKRKHSSKEIKRIAQFNKVHYDKGVFVCKKGELQMFHDHAKDRGFQSFSKFIRVLTIGQ